MNGRSQKTIYFVPIELLLVDIRREQKILLKPVLRNKVNFVARQNYVTQNTDCEWLKRFLVRTFIFILAFHQTITKNKLETFEC